MSFDPNMTYWQSLRIVARGLIQWPLNRYEIKQIAEALKDAAVYLGAPLARLLALILLPISAPLFALLVQMDRRKTAEKIAERKAGKASQPQGGDK